MSEDNIFSKLSSSSSGPFRPTSRPPLSSSTGSINNNMSGKEDITNFLTKESSFNDAEASECSQQSEATCEDNKSDKSHSDDDKSIEGSEDNSNYSENVDKNEDDVESFPEKFKHAEEHKKVNNTSVNRKDFTDSSVYGSPVEKHTEKTQTKKLNYANHYYIIAILIVVCSVLIRFSFSYMTEQTTKRIIDINTLKEKFPTQDEELWIFFESGVSEVVKYKKPSTFILLYKKEAENTLEDILKQLTEYATCIITDCLKEPIIVTDTELSSPAIIEDYGRIIYRYRAKLEDSGVMVVKNLENVQGVAAQAFHSFCDEYSPLVEKSLIIFTMQINELEPPNKTKFVEEYFRNKWADINSDTFGALITRITSMVLVVKP